MTRRPACGDWQCKSHGTPIRRTFMAHPKRHDDLRIVRDGIIGALVLFAVVVGSAVWL